MSNWLCRIYTGKWIKQALKVSKNLPPDSMLRWWPTLISIKAHQRLTKNSRPVRTYLSVRAKQTHLRDTKESMNGIWINKSIYNNKSRDIRKWNNRLAKKWPLNSPSEIQVKRKIQRWTLIWLKDQFKNLKKHQGSIVQTKPRWIRKDSLLVQYQSAKEDYLSYNPIRSLMRVLNSKRVKMGQ